MAMNPIELRKKYLSDLLENSFSQHVGNWPKYRFGESQYGEVHKSANVRYMEAVLDNLDKHAQAIALFEDEKSRGIYHELLQYRSLGPEHVMLYTHDAVYEQYVKCMETEPIGMRLIEKAIVNTGRWVLDLYFIPEYRFKVISSFAFSLSYMHFRQYFFSRGGVTVAPIENDVVLDCGACWGDTALLFAKAVGPGGHVHSFEFLEENAAVFEINWRLNPEVIENISLCRQGLSDAPGLPLRAMKNGPGTSVRYEGDPVATSTTIDDYVRDKKLDVVDFIKMDIEGSEMKALAGAEWTIQAFRPKLAISVYHGFEDMFNIPLTLKEMFPWYHLYLEHHSTYGEETVLYATVDECEFIDGDLA